MHFFGARQKKKCTRKYMCVLAEKKKLQMKISTVGKKQLNTTKSQ